MGCASSHVAEAREAQLDFHECYSLGRKLGRGAFAQVRVATPVKCGYDTLKKAVKILDLRDEDEPVVLDKEKQKQAKMEASLWLAARCHKNVIYLFDVFHDDSCCYCVMEKCAGGLYQHLQAIPDFNERSLGGIVAQMLAALSHVHSVGVVHRDVKPDNFLMGGSAGLTVMLGDFGLSTFLPKSGKLRGVYGTAPFMCPEMVEEKGYDEKADVWSIGVLVYCLVFGDFPYVPKKKTSKAMKQAIIDGTGPKFAPVSTCSGRVRSCTLQFIQDLLHRNPDHRPLAKEALQMPYIKGDQNLRGDNLPSLRHMLYAAKKAGAFEFRDLFEEAELDILLNLKQSAKRSNALPVSKSSPPVSKSPVKSDISSPANSWSNKASVSTTASADSNFSSPPLSTMSSFNQANSKVCDV